MKITKSQLKEIIRETINESGVMTYSSLDNAMKELGINKIPISSRDEQTLKGMVKEKFIDKITNVERLVYFVESLGKEKSAYRMGKKPLSVLVDKFWNDISSIAINFGGKMAAYSVAMNMKDMKANGEQIDSPYEMLKEYFKNFGMDYGRSKVFDLAYKNLIEWMKRNKLSESMNKNQSILTEWSANEVLKQLGGNKFIAMTGAKNFMTDDAKKTIYFKIPRAKSGITHVRITLKGSDTYTMEFISLRGANLKIVKKVDGVYNDQLQSVFTQYTGLYTSL